MITILTTILSGFLTGGATGLLGNAIRYWFDLKNKRIDVDRELQLESLRHANTMEMAKLDMQKVAMQIEGKVREEQVIADGVVAKAEQERMLGEAELDAELRAAALEADKASYFGFSRSSNTAFGNIVKDLVSLMLGFVDFIRGLTRPTLTFMLVCMNFALFKFLERLGAASLTPETATQLWLQVVWSLIALTTMAVTFWFGGRSSVPTPKEK